MHDLSSWLTPLTTVPFRFTMPNWQDFLHFWGWQNSWVLYSCFLTHLYVGRATNVDSISWLWAVLIWTQAAARPHFSLLRRGRAGSHGSSIFSCFWRLYTLFSTVTRLIYILGVLAVTFSSLGVKTRESVNMGPDRSSRCIEGGVTEPPFPVYPASLHGGRRALSHTWLWA